jgi:hypothetical protein
METFQTSNEYSPQGPWAFIKKSLIPIRSREDAEFILSWVALTLAGAWSLKSRWLDLMTYSNGSSMLAQDWGTRLSGNDLVYFIKGSPTITNVESWVGSVFILLSSGILFLILRSGWRLQAHMLGQSARFSPWIKGLGDALIIGFLPTILLGWLLSWLTDSLRWIGSLPMMWAAFVWTILLPMALTSFWMMQWSICRVQRLLEPVTSYKDHLRFCFYMIWKNIGSWLSLAIMSTALRVALSYGALWMAWRWGAGTSAALGSVILIQVGVTILNAGILRCLLVNVVHFLSNQHFVLKTVEDLKRRVL